MKTIDYIFIRELEYEYNNMFINYFRDNDIKKNTGMIGLRK